MIDNANILVHRVDDEAYLRWVTGNDTKDIRQAFEFEWVGPEDGVVGVAMELLEDFSDILNVMPWKLAQVGYDQIKDIAYYQRSEFVK